MASVVPNERKNKAPEEEEASLPTDGIADIHQALKALRMDEVVGLASSKTNLRTVNSVNNYVDLCLLETGRYIRFVSSTIVYILGSAVFGGLGLFDLFSITFFGFGGIVFLFFVLIFCLGMHFPALVRIYYMWAKKYGGGLGLVNSGNPNLFKALTPAQAEAAKKALSADFKDTKNTADQRYFDLDIGKMLLQIASVIYEHENDAIREAVKITSLKMPQIFKPIIPAAAANVANTAFDYASKGVSAFSGFNSVTEAVTRRAGNLINEVIDGATASAVSDALDSKGDAMIRKFATDFGLDFEPISELNNTASAFAGLFWDPKSNWIVVSFKGTAPIEFGEWLSDFNTKLVSAGTHIPGFGKVHLGFRDRVFPPDLSTGGARPFDTISMGIKTLSKWLRKNNKFSDDTRINVWFTGHSLGCATASLVYSKALMTEKESFGKKTVLRDAYLYAAPIVCDRQSVDTFNSAMVANKKKIKTMWRITSNGDAVATLLPELGDYRQITVSPNNAFAFAHLGTELIMKDHPHSSHVNGVHINFGTPVAIHSSFTPEEIAQQRVEHLQQPGEQRRESIGMMLQHIPLIGRVIAHCTIFYWDQLDRVAVGKCDWTTF